MTDLSLEEKIQGALDRVAGMAPGTALHPANLDPTALAALIDHTLLKPEAGEEQIRQMAAEALKFGFASVCVNPLWVALCADLLAGSPVSTCSVIGFPLGATLPAIKVYEVEQVAALGANEVDMVLSVGRLRDGDVRFVYRDIAEVAAAAHDHGLILKVIFETGLLTDAQKIAACVIAQEAGADFVKTATGFSGGGATVADVALMRATVGTAMGVKAAGGIRTATDAQWMVAAGANRLGTSAGVRILREVLEGAAPGKATVQGDSY